MCIVLVPGHKNVPCGFRDLAVISGTSACVTPSLSWQSLPRVRVQKGESSNLCQTSTEIAFQVLRPRHSGNFKQRLPFPSQHYFCSVIKRLNTKHWKSILLCILLPVSLKKREKVSDETLLKCASMQFCLNLRCADNKGKMFLRFWASGLLFYE